MKREVLVVIGMHRSGTSLAMQALTRLGAQTGGPLMEADTFNAEGYWEPPEIVALHENLLSQLERDWGRPEHLLPVPQPWWHSSSGLHAQLEVQELLAARLAQTAPSALLALKDPRLTLFLPLWYAAAQALDVNLSVVLCLRNPADVAASLHHRDHMAPELATALWLHYTTAALAYIGQRPVFVLRHDDWATDPEGTMARLSTWTGSQTAAASPYVPALSHRQDATLPGTQNALACRIWTELSALPDQTRIAPALTAQAQIRLEMAADMAILAQSLRAEQGATPSFMALRDLRALRSGNQRLHDAYEAEARKNHSLQTDLATLRQNFTALHLERDQLYDRAQELLEAYQTEARTSAARHEMVGDLTAQTQDLLRAQAEACDLQAHIATQAQRIEELTQALQAEQEVSHQLRHSLTELAQQRTQLMQQHSHLSKECRQLAQHVQELQHAHKAQATQIDALQRAVQQLTQERNALNDRLGHLQTAYDDEASALSEIRQKLRWIRYLLPWVKALSPRSSAP